MSEKNHDESSSRSSKKAFDPNNPVYDFPINTSASDSGVSNVGEANSSNDKFYIEDYPVIGTTPNKSHAIIVVNENFSQTSTPRLGAKTDYYNMKDIANKIGFTDTTYVKKDMSKNDFEDTLENIRRKDHSECDGFLFMISSHGGMQQTVRKKGEKEHVIECADNQTVFTQDILQSFNDVNCPSLKGKPKIFIIEACRASPQRKVDLVIIIHSPKIENSDCLKKLWLFCKDLVRHAHIHPEFVRIGIINTCNDDTFYLHDSKSYTKIKTAIEKTLKKCKPTTPRNTYDPETSLKNAINRTRTEMFEEHNGHRIGVDKVCIIVKLIGRENSPEQVADHTDAENNWEIGGIKTYGVGVNIDDRREIEALCLSITAHKMNTIDELAQDIFGDPVVDNGAVYGLYKEDNQPHNSGGKTTSGPTPGVDETYSTFPVATTRPLTSSYEKAPDQIDKSADSLSCYKDMVVLYATPPNMLAWRNLCPKGSWMIHHLHKVIIEPDRPKNLLKIFTKVAACMSKDESKMQSRPDLHKKKSVSYLEHNLTKIMKI